MESRTFTGKTVDEATGTALKSLGVELEDVDIRVVSPGRSGILGLGGAPAIIEVRLLKKPESAAQPPARSQREQMAPPERIERAERPERAPRVSAGAPVEDVPAPRGEAQSVQGERRVDGRGRRHRGGDRRRWREERGPRAPGVAAEEKSEVVTGHGAAQEEPAGARPPAEAVAAAAQPPSEEELAAEQDYPEAPPAERDTQAEEVVAKLLDYFLSSMGVVAETFVRDELDSGSLVFEIEGPDAGLLIGRRGETLQALQFMVRMVTNRQLGRKSYVIIDVEGYRERRADMLRRLARRTAGRVAASGRPASLEPMTPGERRIIHMTLADHDGVRTESEGEGNRRRVVVLPRRGPGPDRGPREEADGRSGGGRGYRSRRYGRGYGRRDDASGERSGEDRGPGESGAAEQPVTQGESPEEPMSHDEPPRSHEGPEMAGEGRSGDEEKRS